MCDSYHCILILYSVYEFACGALSLLFWCLSIVSGLHICMVLYSKMSSPSLIYVGFRDVARYCTHNITYCSWVLFSPTNKIMSLSGISFGLLTNNVAEYSSIIYLFLKDISVGIYHLDIKFD